MSLDLQEAYKRNRSLPMTPFLVHSPNTAVEKGAERGSFLSIEPDGFQGLLPHGSCISSVHWLGCRI